MSEPRKEYSQTTLASRGYSRKEVREKIEDTKRRMAQPGYAEREAKRKAKIEKRNRRIGIKFPDLAKQKNLHPSIAHAQHRFNLIK
ncbi:MAG: hypothetical protein AB8D78_01530 [Akkermansiaceae bacterium]